MKYRIVIVEDRDYRVSNARLKGYDAMPKSKDPSRRYYAVLMDDPGLELDEQNVAFIKLPGGLKKDLIDEKIESALAEGFGYNGIYVIVDDRVKPAMIPEGNISKFRIAYPKQYEAIVNDIKELPYVPSREDIIKRIRKRLMRWRELQWSHDKQRREEEAKMKKKNNSFSRDKENSVSKPAQSKPLIPMIATVTNIDLYTLSGSTKDIPTKFKTGVLVPSEKVTNEVRKAVKKKLERLIAKKYGAEVKITNPESLDITLTKYEGKL